MRQEVYKVTILGLGTVLAYCDLLVLVKRHYCMGVECVRDAKGEDVGS